MIISFPPSFLALDLTCENHQSVEKITTTTRAHSCLNYVPWKVWRGTGRAGRTDTNNQSESTIWSNRPMRTLEIVDSLIPRNEDLSNIIYKPQMTHSSGVGFSDIMVHLKMLCRILSTLKGEVFWQKKFNINDMKIFFHIWDRKTVIYYLLKY